MTTTQELINYCRHLADNGIGTDIDGVWGTQCVDLPGALSKNFFNNVLWGNAIDLLDSAKSLGYRVEYNIVGNIDSRPKKGAVYVMDTTSLYGHPFGHTGVVIEDSDGYTMKTIEQNVDGNADSLVVGGPARYVTRSFDGVIGWFYFPVDDSERGIAQEVPNFVKEATFVQQNGIFTVGVERINVRAAATTDSEVVAFYEKGMRVNYDGYIVKDDYVWISYIAQSGNRRYMACGNSDGTYNVNPWGTFE